MDKLKFLVDIATEPNMKVETENLKIDTFNITKKDNNLAVTQGSTDIFMLGKNESGQSYFNLGTEVLTDSQLKALREGAVSAGATPLATDFTALADFGRYKANSTVPATGKTLSEMIESAYFKASEGLEYILNADGASYSVQKGTCTDIDVVIASTYEGLPVTEIGSGAFRDCSRLRSIVIPDSVTSIGYDAFYNCESLESINIPDGVTSISGYMFHGCSSLASITVPDSVTNIDNYVFCNCTSLKSITIPDSVESIGSGAFSSCSGLTNITIPNSVESIGMGTFFNCESLESMTIPFIGANKDGTSDTHFGYIFGANLYSNNHDFVPLSLKNVVITGSTSIETGAFLGCQGLTNIEISHGITLIGEWAFDGCDNLENITIPNSVIIISSAVFRNCTSLKSIEIPDSVTSIGQEAFSGCTSLESMTLPFVGATKDGTSNTHFGYIFGARDYAFNSTYVPSSLKTVIITGGTNIGEWAFSDCASLESIVIPDSVTTIGSSAFQTCTSLKSIIIPYSVTSIGAYAFYYCWDLIIYCEARTKRSGWDTNWEHSSPDDVCHTIWDIGPMFRNQANIIQKLQVQIQELAAQIQKLQNK